MPLRELRPQKVKGEFLARVIGEERTAMSGVIALCWHCHGLKTCSCASCCKDAPPGIVEPGQCTCCKGTKYLTRAQDLVYRADRGMFKIHFRREG